MIELKILFDNLIGYWNLEREIIDYDTHNISTAKGTASFHKVENENIL